MTVIDAIRSLLNTQSLSPHGICLLWRPELIWTHVAADTLIGLAYFSIPAALGVFVYKRPDVKFGWAIWMFVAFILLCGLTHFMSILTLWRPYYGIEALLKAATAIASVVTAIALWPLLPKVIALPSPANLVSRIAERDRALAELQSAMATMVAMQEHETRQKLLIDELNHRVKNTLASVQSIAVQTMANSNDLTGFRDTFIERLMALSATHNLLVKAEWRSASLHDLLRQILAPYGKPYAIEGPDFLLDPNYVVSLGMALNELATNAVKHGAWSGSGRVDVALAVAHGDQPDEVCLTWTETGGPATTPPTRRGFGSRLLERGVAAELGGRVTLEFAPTGLICTICAPQTAKFAPVTLQAA
jgi:two-component sensor histidine kinase